MKPEQNSHRLLKVTRSKAKMYEYDVPQEHHIQIYENPDKLFAITIGLLGELAANINRENFNQELLTEQKKNLLFSACFFDSYIHSKLNSSLDSYFVLLGSASYYLCDLPGSSLVLSRYIKDDYLDLAGEGLEDLLLWLLQGDLGTFFDGSEGVFGDLIDKISQSYLTFTKNGRGENSLLQLVTSLREFVYASGSSRQLLLGDVIAAIVRKKIDNSVWKALPVYSGLHSETWSHVLRKESFIKEFWPAQHLLGEKQVFKGKSAIIQMPTSAGKTKSVELIIRSAFLAERASLAVIVAPFRALCHEIKNSLLEAFHGETVKIDDFSDVFQLDFEFDNAVEIKQIFIVTPEKLLYILRQSPEIAPSIELLIFDEGHQFDNGTRGITYELLLTSLLLFIPENIQKILISAVISNAQEIATWLIGESYVINGNSLIPTPKSIAFASWKDQLGRVEYVNKDNIDEDDFFVPRVINSINLGKQGNELKNRFFPVKGDSSSTALYLGFKLISQGGIAIFCGRKDTASGICKKAIEAIKRNVPLPLPIEFSDNEEIGRLYYLYAKNLGENSTATLSAKSGIYAHHNNTPHGIRLSIEHAMRENLIKFVVCTSTLAQGVNLPIRYLIVASTQQGTSNISVRDFHNLIGRAGRAGMHTEGSILFSDVHIYDNKRTRYQNWRWNEAKKLLDFSQTEDCASSILQLIPLKIKNDKSKNVGHEELEITVDILVFAKIHILGWEEIKSTIQRFSIEYGSSGFTAEKLEEQFKFFSSTLSSIESFILSNFDLFDEKFDISILAEKTLAYSLASENQKNIIKELFELLYINIDENIKEDIKKKTLSKTLYGINESSFIEEWVNSNLDELFSIKSGEDFIESIWSLFLDNSNNKNIKKINNKNVLKEITKKWISGESFHELFKIAEKNNCKLGQGKRPRNVTIENIVDMTEGGISYDGALLIGAIREFISLTEHDEKNETISLLNFIQKQFKYGLPTEQSILLYEIGFSDRIIAQDLASILNLTSTQKQYVISEVKQRKDEVFYILTKYPSYFQSVLSKITA